MDRRSGAASGPELDLNLQSSPHTWSQALSSEIMDTSRQMGSSVWVHPERQGEDTWRELLVLHLKEPAEDRPWLHPFGGPLGMSTWEETLA